MRCASLALTLLAAVLGAVILTGNARAQYYNPAQGLFQESGYDFKGVPRNTTPRHSFVFTNNGTSDLTLVSARVSCQCTKVFIPEKRLYKPGEKGEVVAQLDAVRFTGTRHVTVTVTFQRNGSVFEVPLNVAGVILENVSVQPQNLNFQLDQVAEGKEPTAATKNLPQQVREQTVRVIYPGVNETVARATTSNPYVEVKVGKPQRIATGTQTNLTVSVREDAPAGYVNAVVQLWSNGANRNTPLTVNVSGVVRAPLTVSPATLTFSTSHDGKKIVKNIVLAASSEFTLKEIRSTSRSIDGSFPKKAARPTRVCVVPISFDPEQLRDEPDMALITIETTDGRSISLDAQISSGNFELAHKKNLSHPAASDTAVAKKSDDDFSDAKISVSGVQNQEKSENAEKNEDAGKVVEASAAETTEKREDKRDVSPLTLSSSRPVGAYRDAATPRAKPRQQARPRSVTVRSR